MFLVTMSVISVDFATQAAINPCESLVADTIQQQALVTDDSLAGYDEGSGLGFKVYSYMTNLGCCVGYLLSTVDWKTAGSSIITSRVQAHYLLSTEQSLFLLITILFSISSVITLISAKEKKMKQYISLRSVEENLDALNGKTEVNVEYRAEKPVLHDDSINVINNKLIFQEKYRNTRVQKFKRLGSLVVFIFHLVYGSCKIVLKFVGRTLFCSKNLVMTVFKKVYISPIISDMKSIFDYKLHVLKRQLMTSIFVVIV